MTEGTGDSRRVLGFLDSISSAYPNRRRFLKQLLAGSALVVTGATAGFLNKTDLSQLSTDDASVFSIGGLKLATENFAKFTISERDQTHVMFNNTWGDPDGLHMAMIAALSMLGKFEAMAAWDWPHWNYPYIHAWHSIYHGLDPAADINSDDRFPFPISSYRRLTLDIPNVYVAGDGKWGLAFDMFLFKQQPFTNENVQAEVFVVLKRAGYSVPHEVDSLSSRGISYAHGQWPSNPKLHVFWRKDDPVVPFRQTIDIYDFVNFLKGKGFVQNDNLLSGIFLGAEPIEGSGMWCIDSFYASLAL